MKNINEIKVGNSSRFIVEESYSGEKVKSSVVRTQTATIQKDKKTFYMIYDSSMNVISNAFKFLNYNPKNKADNTITKDMYALRYLYIYSEIIEKDIDTFVFNDFVRLNYFLKGVSANGYELELNLLTKRGNSSINGMFTVYRAYFKFLRLMDSAVFREKSYSKYIPKGNERDSKSNRGPSTNSLPKLIETPKYISVEEFKEIIKYIRENIKDKEEALRAECIIRIMFEGGLRLGEALGSTLEDYVIQEVGSGDGIREICFVYIRNRVSDRKFQKAKTCLNVHNKSNYRKFEYNTKNIGYQLSFISIDTYDLICKYIDFTHERAYKKCRVNYDKFKADSVGEYRKKNEDNYYLFLNKKGTPMSDVTWNKSIREIFEAVGIKVDYEVKRYNLSHRLRHGFIMNLILNVKMEREKVMLRSRHKAYRSLDCYYNPTIEQIVEMKTDIEDKILDLSDI